MLTTDTILHVICTVYNRAISLRQLVDCFLLQTSSRWQLHIVNDGAATPEINAVMALYSDPRITFMATPTVNGVYGHPNRKLMLEILNFSPNDFVLITNDDNYYVPKFVEYFLNECHTDVGFVYCDTIHSYMGYNILKTQVKENLIDMGSFIVRSAMAKKTGFVHTHISADGAYAVECAENCKKRSLKITYIPKSLFVHN
jgi:hypothetical protein